MARTSTAPRRRTVTRAEVVAAARDILDAQGAAGLTMASASARVGLTTMGVYRHVKNREDLVAGAVELVLEDISAGGPDDDLDWLDAVGAWMDSVRSCLLAHPWAATRLGSPDGGSNEAWTRAIAVLGAHLASSPLAPAAQARALTWTVRLTVGFLILEIGGPIARTAPPRRRRADTLAGALAEMTDDDLWSDVIAQTRLFLTALT
jgi:AcrR family transcriptional regulator